MALDVLLYYRPPRHLYRYDLESFFWVLVWITVAYNSKKKKFEPIKEWNDNALRGIGEKKRAFLDSPQTLLASAPNKEYKDLRDTWVESLHTDIFVKVYAEYTEFVTRYKPRLVRARKAALAAEALSGSNAPDATASQVAVVEKNRSHMGGQEDAKAESGGEDMDEDFIPK